MNKLDVEFVKSENCKKGLYDKAGSLYFWYDEARSKSRFLPAGLFWEFFRAAGELLPFQGCFKVKLLKGKVSGIFP